MAGDGSACVAGCPVPENRPAAQAAFSSASINRLDVSFPITLNTYTLTKVFHCHSVDSGVPKKGVVRGTFGLRNSEMVPLTVFLYISKM